MSRSSSRPISHVPSQASGLAFPPNSSPRPPSPATSHTHCRPPPNHCPPARPVGPRFVGVGVSRPTTSTQSNQPSPSGIKGPNEADTHFVSLPLAMFMYPELAKKLENFQKSILSNSGSCSDLGIDKSIFINPKTFHLTVVMLKLWNKERVDAASKVLKGMSSKIRDELKKKPVIIKLNGLACMRGSPDKANIIYAPVEEIGNEGRLLCACHRIIDAFAEAGLVVEKDAKERLKFHATVINVRHSKRNTKTEKFDSFDARDIFKQYGLENWGEYRIREAHLSQRFLYEKNGYFHCCASVQFP